MVIRFRYLPSEALKHESKCLAQAVSGIAFPSGSDKLYSGSEDEAVRVWDCQSGQVTVVSLLLLG